MQKITSLVSVAEIAHYMDEKVLNYIRAGQLESLDSYSSFAFWVFDWYDIHSEDNTLSKVMIYLDREDLFVICESERAEKRLSGIFKQQEEDALSNEQRLYHFLVGLLKGDMDHLDRFEDEIDSGEEEFLLGEISDALGKISLWRRELLRLKHYYEQLDTVFDEMKANDNGFLSEKMLAKAEILSARNDRYLDKIKSLQEIVAQLRETYQSELAIQQNNLMKVFTIITAIFLPLSLLAGWYGMNFQNMPELGWRYGYPLVICISLCIVIGLVWYFKHKKWL